MLVIKLFIIEKIGEQSVSIRGLEQSQKWGNGFVNYLTPVNEINIINPNSDEYEVYVVKKDTAHGKMRAKQRSQNHFYTHYNQIRFIFKWYFEGNRKNQNNMIFEGDHIVGEYIWLLFSDSNFF